jgi:hypothetical protein
MKPTYIAAASSFVLALALAGPVMAAGMSEGQADATNAPAFSDLDTDGNGYLTKQEAEGSSGLANNWEQADSNGDQQIDSTEFAAFEIGAGSPPSDPMEAVPESGGGASPSRQY